MDNRVYWIWLQQVFGEGSEKPYHIYRRFPGGVEEFYEGGPSLWNRMRFISHKEAHGLYSRKLEECQLLLDYCLKLGWTVLTPESEGYPERLRHIYDPPAVLYGKGTLPPVDDLPTVAVVGARKPSAQSEEMARAFGFQLASGNALVVSGGAIGVDRNVLLGALSGMGRVISVLPVALTSNYVADNSDLRRAVVEKGGMLLTEYATQAQVAHGTFQVRNRLLSGLSCGVLVIQAAGKSGTMITARCAKEQDRDVFVYPGPPGAAGFEGSLGLIEDGAVSVETGEEILAEYEARFAGQAIRPPVNLFSRILDERQQAQLADPGSAGAPSEQTTEGSCEAEATLSPEEAKVMEVLSGEAMHLSPLAEATGISAVRLLSLLTQLELDGKVQALSGKRYQRAKR